ncbi:hypothetical protein JOJ86_007436 [Rhodococcus percolatus]|nr:hypothetical protein [Rhodococcus opacus]MBP2209643.1 hypothetical protein [Rhodococcus opacus]
MRTISPASHPDGSRPSGLDYLRAWTGASDPSIGASLPEELFVAGRRPKYCRVRLIGATELWPLWNYENRTATTFFSAAPNGYCWVPQNYGTHGTHDSGLRGCPDRTPGRGTRIRLLSDDRSAYREGTGSATAVDSPEEGTWRVRRRGRRAGAGWRARQGPGFRRGGGQLRGSAVVALVSAGACVRTSQAGAPCKTPSSRCVKELWEL